MGNSDIYMEESGLTHNHLIEILIHFKIIYHVTKG